MFLELAKETTSPIYTVDESNLPFAMDRSKIIKSKLLQNIFLQIKRGSQKKNRVTLSSNLRKNVKINKKN